MFTDKQAASFRLVECVKRLNQWLRQNRFTLNVDKTHLIWLDTRQQLAKLTIKQLKLDTSVVYEFDDEASDLGVVVDSQLSMASHIGIAAASHRRNNRRYRGRLVPNF